MTESEHITSLHHASLGYLTILEDLTTEVLALRTVLAMEAEPVAKWRDQVANQKIVCAPKVHALFASYRAQAGETPPQNHLPFDVDSVVRRILDTVPKPPDPQD
jgi:hypothetical protein